MNARCAVLLTVLVLANLPFVAFGEDACLGTHAKILDIRNNTGTVACALFESPAGFPSEFLHSATNVMIIKIKKSQARCDFMDIRRGPMRWSSFMMRI